MLNRHMKICSTSLIIKEMQIKTTVRYHLTFVRIAIISKSRNNKYGPRSGETETLVHCWWESKLVQPLWKIVWRFLKKIAMELPYDPVKIPLLRIYLKKPKTEIQKDICIHPHVHCSNIYNSQAMEVTQVPINRQVYNESSSKHIYH